MKDNFIAPRVQTVVTVSPSTSGNYRIKVIYTDKGIPPLHCYMKPTGELHVPEGHKVKPVPLDDKEMDWCLRHWKKSNPNVRKEILSSGPIFGKACTLSNNIQSSIEYEKRRKALKEANEVKTTGFATQKLGETKVGGILSELFFKLRRKEHASV